MTTTINYSLNKAQPQTFAAGLDLTLAPPTKFHRQLTLTEKVRTVPSLFLDKLHPAKNNPTVTYTDEGLWKTHITFQKDSLTPPAPGRTYENLNALCDAEMQRRYPNYRVVKGIKAVFKNKCATLCRLLMGDKRFYQELTTKEIATFKKQILFSACNRDDVISRPTILDTELRSQLKLTDDALLQTEHLLSKNSPMNGNSYLTDGNLMTLTSAIASSSDRKVENTANLRVVQTPDKRSIGYAGRTETDHKALEQASFIFLNEIKTHRKGITQTTDAEGNTVYQLDYIVNSLLSAPWAWSAESPIAPYPERAFLEEERKALLKLRENGPQRIPDPQQPGVSYRVQLRPILFNRSVNFFAKLEKWLPPFITGMSRSEEISEEGFNRFQELVRQKASPDKRAQVENILKTLQQNTPPMQELFLRNYLCVLLDLPVVVHCKSSVDRTSSILALLSALHQWMQLKLPLPEKPEALIQDFRFKELFMSNWMAGHQFTRYCRTPREVPSSECLNTDLGLILSRGIGQSPFIADLVPERYLRDYPLEKKIGAYLLYLLAIPFALSFYSAMTLLTAARHVGYLVTKNPKWLGPLRYSLPILPFTLFLKFTEILPEKVLNEDSPQVGARRLIGRK